MISDLKVKAMHVLVLQTYDNLLLMLRKHS